VGIDGQLKQELLPLGGIPYPFSCALLGSVQDAFSPVIRPAKPRTVEILLLSTYKLHDLLLMIVHN
jgi:hypothetical protein